MPTRFGFTCPRALGKAVTRNRIKRRMRESVRMHQSTLTNGWIVVFNPRRTVLEADFSDLCREIVRVLVKCHSSSSLS